MHAVKRVVRCLLILVAWVFVTLAGSLAAAMAYEPLRSFGPMLDLINGALLIVVLGLWRLWHSAPRIAMFATAVVVLGSAALVTATSLSPAGKYAVEGCRGPGYEYTYDEYYELSGGVFYDVVAGHRHRMGSYYKKNGQWVLQIDRRDGELDEQKLRFSLLGFDTLLPPIEGEEYRPTDFERRRLIPFARPRWIPQWLE
jgi:hypothetical protein